MSLFVSPWRPFLRGLRVLINRKAADQEIADEVNHHFEEAAAEYVRRGLSPTEARRAARIELGGDAAVREQVRAWGWENRVENLVADFRYAIRGLAANPSFAAVSILTLALGIGASTAIYSVVYAVLVRALPYPNPQRIVRVWEVAANGHRMNLADPNFDDFRDQNKTLASLAVYGYQTSAVSGGAEPVRINIAAVSTGFFETLGVAPFRGRAFVPEEQRLHGSPAVIVSYGYWQRYLGGAADLSRFHLTMAGRVYSVTGVMPAQFDFPAGVSAWIPRELDAEILSRTAHNWRGLGRLRDGATVAQARAELGAIAHGIRSRYGNKVHLTDAAVTPLADALVGDARTALLTLLCAVMLLLLVACANIAGLLVARTSARRRELAVRSALGAGRGRLIQQLLTESISLAVAGGGVGMLIAIWAVRVLPAILPANLPQQQGIALNMPVLLFALGSIAGVALMLGLFAARPRGSGNTRTTERLRCTLVTGEIAMTLVILTGAALLGRSFVRLISTSPGFDTRNLMTIEFSPPDGDPIRRIQVTDEILRRLRVIPGVASAGLTGAMPVAAGDDLAEGDFLILNDGRPPADFSEFGRMAQNPALVGHALYCLADQGYFQTIGIPLVRGRAFGPQDDWNSPHVAAISETLARTRWPGRNPIGQTIEFGNMDGNLKPMIIVGIVGDVRARGLDLPPSPVIYVNYRQRGIRANASPTIVLRGTGTAAAARGVFRELARDAPVKFSTFEDAMGGWLADRRFLLFLLGSFAAAALALAAIGIYGVVAFSVTRRTREIGIRMALGGGRGDIARLIVGEGARLAAAGVASGVGASLGITRLVASLLYGVSATDPVTFAGVAGLLALTTLLASWLPARRAARLNPNGALRCE